MQKYKCVIRPVLLYGAEYWTVGKKEEELMSRAEMRMLRWILGVSRREKRNEEIGKKCGVPNIVRKVTKARTIMVWIHDEKR